MKILSSFTHVIANLHDLFSSVQHKRRNIWKNFGNKTFDFYCTFLKIYYFMYVWVCEWWENSHCHLFKWR